MANGEDEAGVGVILGCGAGVGLLTMGLGAGICLVTTGVGAGRTTGRSWLYPPWPPWSRANMPRRGALLYVAGSVFS